MPPKRTATFSPGELEHFHKVYATSKKATDAVQPVTPTEVYIISYSAAIWAIPTHLLNIAEVQLLDRYHTDSPPANDKDWRRMEERLYCEQLKKFRMDLECDKQPILRKGLCHAVGFFVVCAPVAGGPDPF